MRYKLTAFIDAHWRLIALAIGLAAFAISLSRMIGLSKLPLSADNAMYLHMVWWVTRRAGRLYLDMWEPRPPLLYELFAVLALPAGDDPLLQYVISMTATLLFGVAVVVFIAQITFELTQHRGASVIAACALLILPGFHAGVLTGNMGKYPYVATGLMALWLALRGRALWAGLMGAASAGIHPFGLMYAIAAYGALWQRGSRVIGRALLGSAIITIVTLIPIVAWGAVPSAIAQVIFSTLLTNWENRSLGSTLRQLYSLFGTGIVVLPVGIAGYVLQGPAWLKSRWWLVLLVVFFTVQVLFIDFDNYPDLYSLTAMAALGVGLLAVAIRPTVRLALAGVVGALLLVSVISLGALSPVAVTPYRMTVGSAYGSNQLGKLFWERKVPSSCHYRFTPSEILWMKLLQRSRDETNCDADIFQRLADLFGQPSPTPHQGSIPNIASGSPPSQGCR